MERHRAILSRLQRDVQGQGLHGPARRRLPDGVLPHGPSAERRPPTALHLGRLHLQSQGTKQGAFFNTDNMQPLMNNAGAAAALDVYKQLSKLGPPDQLNNDVGDSRGLFVTGRCALSLDWGDIGPLAVDPTQSKVQDKVGAVILPGSKQVLDRSTGQLVDCNSTTCPYATNGV